MLVLLMFPLKKKKKKRGKKTMVFAFTMKN